MHRKIKTQLFTTIICVSALLFGGSVVAQPAPVPSADPGRIIQQLDEFTGPQENEREVVTPQTQDIEIPEGFDDVTFTLKSIEFDGMTVYTREDIAPFYEEMLGKQVSLADMVGLANRLTARYRKDGYILSRAIVPEQRVKQGEVTIKVFEGYINEVTIEEQSDIRGGAGLVRYYADRITELRPLQSNELERVLLLANDLPGIRVRSILTPAPNVVGAANVQLVVTQEDWSANVFANNRGTRYIGEFQVGVSARINSPFHQHDSVQLSYITAPDDNELHYFGLDYALPIGQAFGLTGTTLRAGLSHSETKPGYTLEPFEIEGESTRFNLAVEHPVIRTRRENLDTYISFEALNSENNANVAPLEFEDKIRSLRAGFDYSRADQWQGFSTLNFEVSKGLKLFGATDDPSQGGLSRGRGQADYTKFTAEFSRLQALPSLPMNLLFAAKGQKSANTLLSSEEFGLGGSRYLRAYDPSEVVGEDGYAASLELRYNGQFDNPNFSNYQLYGFYDVGSVWNDDAVDRRTSLASAGVGVRWAMFERVNADLSLAVPLTQDVETEGDDDARLFFSLSAAFN